MDLQCAVTIQTNRQTEALNPAGERQNAPVASFRIPQAQSYGGVLLSGDGKVLLREPLAHMDGYVWTWPKGRPEIGETPAQTALREVYEETGYRARIVGVLPGVYIGTTRTNAFFLMEPVGEQEAIVNETEQTRWVSFDEAYRLIEHTKHPEGRNRDRAVLDDTIFHVMTEKFMQRLRTGFTSQH